MRYIKPFQTKKILENKYTLTNDEFVNHTTLTWSPEGYGL